GGTSVGKATRMKQIIDLILKDNEPKIVVLSALSGTTNTLVSMCESLKTKNYKIYDVLLKDLEIHYHNFIYELFSTTNLINDVLNFINEKFDFLKLIQKINYNTSLGKEILAQGEIMSSHIFSFLLQSKDLEHQMFNALEFMQIDRNGEPNYPFIKENLDKILSQFPHSKLFITQGFICLNDRLEIDNLQRGGSDYTASLLAAVTHASVCEIWTDIDGMHNNDPRIVNKTFPIEYLCFEEAAELAYFGAKILHPTCILPAQQNGIPVKLLNTMQPNAVGTTIGKEPKGVGLKAVAAKDGIIALKIKSSRMLLAYGFMAKVFGIFEKFKIPVDMISTSEVTVGITIDNETFLHELVEELETISTVEIIKDLTIIACVGYKIGSQTNIFNELNNTLNNIKPIMICYGGSEHNISYIISKEDKTLLLSNINKQVFKIN
ncbi:MAG: aspartate kinase, partial [Sediminibacterium sp.]|nr:aspartate kinase [Sediminibacterium sp.]